MGKLTRTQLKAFFETGDLPKETEYIDLIDSMVNILDDEGIQRKKVTLINTDMDALFTTSKALITAPGAGKLLYVVGFVVKNNFNTVAWEVGTQDMIIQYATSNNEIGRLLNTFVESSSTIITNGALTDNITMNENQAVEIALPTANPSVGDGNFVIDIFSRIITL